jgi:DNA-binding Lrp family transcriptional regulator
VATPTWATLERPILETVAKHDDDVRGLSSDDVVLETGLPVAAVQRAIKRLVDAGYLEGIAAMTQESTGPEYMNLHLPEAGLREVGTWPGDPYDALLAIVARQLDTERDPERRGRLQKLRDGLLGVGRDVVTGVLTAYTSGQLPK